jgi:hypothetical protein
MCSLSAIKHNQACKELYDRLKSKRKAEQSSADSRVQQAPETSFCHRDQRNLVPTQLQKLLTLKILLVFNTVHVSFYMALLQYWKEQGFVCPMYVFSHDIMQTAKILFSATYHKSIRDLNEFGYIRYEPSYKRNQGSKIYMVIH